MKQLQRVGARALRYSHESMELDDGRWLLTYKRAEYDTGEDLGRIRDVARAQRERWVKGRRLDDDEKPIEVLCTVHPITRKRALILLDIDALRRRLLGSV